MSDVVEKFISTIVDAGLSLRSPDFSTEIALDSDCSNVTAGILRGLGPRYGMSPLVSQSTIQPVNTGPNTYGFLGSTLSVGNEAVHDLYRIYGILSVPLIDQSQIGTAFTSIPQKKTYYFAAIGINDSSISPTPNFFAFVPFGESSAPTIYTWTMKAALAYGILRPAGLDNSGVLAESPWLLRLNTINGLSVDTPPRSLGDLSGMNSATVDYCSLATLSVSGSTINAPWIVGTRITQAGGESGTANFNGSFGSPNFIIDRKFKDVDRAYSLYNVSTANGLESEFVYNKRPTNTDLLAVSDQDTTTAALQGTWVSTPSATVARLDGAGAGASNFILWHDIQNYMNTEHTLLLAAFGKPYALIVQSWQRAANKSLEQFVDLRNRRFKPTQLLTTIPGGASRYLVNSVGAGGGTPVSTSWFTWPSFTRGTALVTDAASARNGQIHVTLGAANSGILRANTVYEIAYSIFDKQLGNESNVGTPALIQTGAADFVGLTLFRDQVSGGNYMQRIAAGTTCAAYVPLSTLNYIVPGASPTSSGGKNAINYIEIRVYYRPEGSFEWLPALYIDAASYFYNPNLKELYACTGAIAGSVGGQPGGFNDYSELPDDAWNCVVVWKQRVFWLSDKSLVYSMTNNGFAYPVRNAVPIPQGSYKGAIVHNYPGQAEQDSRLVVFGTKEIYVGKFTGIRQQQWIQVSADEGGVFDVDGTDFVLNAWTSITAFSYRSACVADGILYYWGPQGVYRDDGRDTPTKISDDIEPNLFNLYAKQRTDDIHCVYSEQTKEITWFYFENGVYSTYDATQEQTKLLVYNTQTQQFFFGGMSACIDGSQKLITGAGVQDLVRSTDGDRTIVFSRVSKASSGIQQAYFFDYRNRAGDLRYGLERMVNVIATPATGQRRLTLPNGATGISVGDYISTDQIQAYTNNQDSGGTAITVEDFVGKVVAVNTTGTNYIDVLLPTDLTNFQGAATLNALTSFPIYVSKTILAANASAGNAIPYSLETTFWCPNGLMYNAFWLYVHLLLKVELLKAEGLGLSPGFTFSHRTPTAPDWESQTIIFGREVDGVWDSTLNCSSNYQQTYHPLSVGEDGLVGQGLKLKLSGLHYAHKWVLQYLAAFANPQEYDFLKQFEG